MVKTWTHGIINTNGIDLDSWYRIGTPESHMIERAECCPYAAMLAAQLCNCRQNYTRDVYNPNNLWQFRLIK